jgi:glycerophosphoryl diester phosphodiesterase
MIKIIYILMILVGLTSCISSFEPISIPDYKSNINKKTKAIDINKMKLIEGIYQITKGAEPYGKYAVVKQIKDGFTFFFKNNSSYAINLCGELNKEIVFEGYWRIAENSKIGTMSLVMSDTSGAKQILAGTKPDNPLIIGTYESETGTKKIQLEYYKDLPKIYNYIIAHRAGGRNQDRLPASENSVEMIKYSEYLGTNAIEIDIRLTNDNIPVLFHDEYLNKRLIKEDYLLGKVSDYSFKQLKSFCTLKYGEKIPSLEEALDAVVNQTDLKLVWLDIKSADVAKIVAPIQKKYIDLAKQKGKKLEIVMGFADEAMLNSYKSIPNYCNYPSLVELDYNLIDIDCFSYWAPRWSLGIQNEIVQQVHSRGKKAFVWTLDVPEFITTFIRDGHFDGILTNYPTQVAYEYYLQK